MICHIHVECLCVHVHAKVALHMCGDHRTNYRRKFFLPPWVPEIELKLSGLCFKGIDPRVFGWSWSEVFLNNCDDIFSTIQIIIFLSLQEWGSGAEYTRNCETWTLCPPHHWTDWKFQPFQRWVWAMMKIAEVLLHHEITFANIYILMPEKCVLVSHIVILISWLSQKQRNKNEYQYISLCVILTEQRASVFHWGIQSG